MAAPAHESVWEWDLADLAASKDPASDVFAHARLLVHPEDREAARGRQTGRTQEIQRLIGRSLRAVVDLKKMGEKQIKVDSFMAKMVKVGLRPLY